MKVLFIVQGEGRGHMTQALSLEQILEKNGHYVSNMVIGTSKCREIPTFFKDRTRAELHLVKSPNFYFDKNHKSINLWKTFFKNVIQIPLFLREIEHIRKIVKHEKPEVIVNFYDVLGGFYFLLANPNSKRLSLGHQYLADHSTFSFPSGSFFQKNIYRLNNFLTWMNCHKKLALSFDKLSQEKEDTSIVPPLLRKEIKLLQPINESFILTYVVNKGYGEEILTWHEQNPKIKLLCFWDNYDYPDGWSPRQNIIFKHLNDEAFLEAMSSCTGYVSTAGFESICEAMYLNKPVMMVPVKGQFEQVCNALDGKRVGAGISATSFDLGPFLSYITTLKEGNNDFRPWVDSAEMTFIKEIEAFVPKQYNRNHTLLIGLKRKISNILAPHQHHQSAELDPS